MVKKKGFFHGLLMMACCIVPMIALLAFLPQIKNSAVGFNWSWLFLILCPVMHILMMNGMNGNKENCHSKESENKQKDKKKGTQVIS